MQIVKNTDWAASHVMGFKNQSPRLIFGFLVMVLGKLNFQVFVFLLRVGKVAFTS